MNKPTVLYFRNSNIEMVYSKDTDTSFSMHTHVSNYTIIIVLNGSLIIN